MELLETLGDFTSRENWDRFFTIRGSGDAFEWYAEWPGLRDALLPQLSSIEGAAARDGGNRAPPPLQILVPGCGSSRMSEHLYDAGYRNVTNIDFSKVVVSDMLRQNVRARPEMRWRVMDMTEMQFADEFFDAIIDKGGLDALMEPKLGAKFGSKFLKEIRAHEWLFSSEEGQWTVVESSKAARLIMVFLDSRHSHASIDVIQRDLSPLVKRLAPGDSDNEAPIPFMMASDGITQRNIVKKVTSTITGPIIIEDVIYENLNGDSNCLTPLASRTFRRLTFERSLGLIQSEALLMQEEHSRNFIGEADKNKSGLSSRHQKKGARRRNDSSKTAQGSRGNLKVDHSYLASSYHSGIISGFILVASALEEAASCGKVVKTLIVGLGAGLLPMSLHGCLPFLDIEVVELDPVILDMAKDYFGFTMDEKLKVHITDGLQFIQRASAAESSDDTVRDAKTDSTTECAVPHKRTGTKSLSIGKRGSGMRILIVDADASDVSSGLTCPPAEFLEESFLLSVRSFVGEGGFFVINLVCRSTAIRETVISRMKDVFNHLFSLELEEDVNEVIFALPSETSIQVENFPEAAVQFQGLLKFNQPESLKTIIDTTKKIKCLK